MGRSHPPTLITLAERTLREECSVARGDRVLVAVSGGPDSMALLDVMKRLAPRLKLGVSAHGVDHGLREQAATELDLAERFAERLKVPFSRSSVSVGRGGNLQARARQARFDALLSAARRADARFIATAHHADDRAETVLIRILRGSAPAALAVLAPEEGGRLRPLIRARKDAILAHIRRHRIPFARDPSNEDRRFLRVRVRREVLPILEELSPGVVSHLNALADELGAEPPPELTDEGGRPVFLKRAHVAQIRRILRLGQRAALVRLPGGRQVRVDPRTGTLHVRDGVE